MTIGESTIITCEGSKKGEKLRAIIEYKEEVSTYSCVSGAHLTAPSLGSENLNLHWKASFTHTRRETALSMND